ncbi:MAG: hypothetical protein ACOH2R_24160 [Pseudomonas sp.]
MTKKSPSKSPMTPDAVERIYSSTAKAGDGTVPAGSFGARAASAAAKNSKGK